MSKISKQQQALLTVTYWGQDIPMYISVKCKLEIIMGNLEKASNTQDTSK